MSSTNNKLRLAGAFAALAALALAVSCTGFFVNPTLTAVSVGPSGLNLTIDETWQMSATGTYSDGSQNAITSGVVWSSDDQSTVSVGQTSGLVKGLQIGSANITAAAGSCSACSGSTSVSVVLNNVTSIVVTPGSASATVNVTPAYFNATADPGSIDITENAIWHVLDSSGTDQTANFTLSYVAYSASPTGFSESFLPGSSLTGVPGTYTVTAGYASTTIIGKATLDVTQ